MYSTVPTEITNCTACRESAGGSSVEAASGRSSGGAEREAAINSRMGLERRWRQPRAEWEVDDSLRRGRMRPAVGGRAEAVGEASDHPAADGRTGGGGRDDYGAAEQMEEGNAGDGGMHKGRGEEKLKRIKPTRE